MNRNETKKRFYLCHVIHKVREDKHLGIQVLHDCGEVECLFLNLAHPFFQPVSSLADRCIGQPAFLAVMKQGNSCCYFLEALRCTKHKHVIVVIQSNQGINCAAIGIQTPVLSRHCPEWMKENVLLFLAPK